MPTERVSGCSGVAHHPHSSSSSCLDGTDDEELNGEALSAQMTIHLAALYEIHQRESADFTYESSTPLRLRDRRSFTQMLVSSSRNVSHEASWPKSAWKIHLARPDHVVARLPSPASSR